MIYSDDDQYLTIENPGEASVRVKGSRFLGMVFPVQSAEQFKQVLKERVKTYHDATHHCWAYRLLVDNKVVAASSDDGEPFGTAGKPILSVIEGRNLMKIGVIITRYFGCTKLGTGGLARAYSNCTNQTLDSVSVVVKTITEQVLVQFPYEAMNIIMRMIDKYDGIVSDSNYETNPRLTVSIPQSGVSNFKRELIDACHGNIRFGD